MIATSSVSKSPCHLQVMDHLTVDWTPRGQNVTFEQHHFPTLSSYCQEPQDSAAPTDSSRKLSISSSLPNMSSSTCPAIISAIQSVRPFACTFCSRTFILKHHLKQHVRLHTGERPFVCDICGRAFVQQASLQHHKCTHFRTQ